MRVLDDGVERQKKEGEKGSQSSLRPPATALLSHAGMLNLRNQSRDVMGFDSAFLTPGAVDLTL